jgi:hypothetical protein
LLFTSRGNDERTLSRRQFLRITAASGAAIVADGLTSGLASAEVLSANGSNGIGPADSFVRGACFHGAGPGSLDPAYGGSGQSAIPALIHFKNVTRGNWAVFIPGWQYWSNADPMSTSDAAQVAGWTSSPILDTTTISGGGTTYSDAELITMIQAARAAGLNVALKPMLGAYATDKFDFNIASSVYGGDYSEIATSGWTRTTEGSLPPGILPLINGDFTQASPDGGMIEIVTAGGSGSAVIRYAGITTLPAEALTGCTYETSGSNALTYSFGSTTAASGQSVLPFGTATGWRACIDPGSGTAIWMTQYNNFISHYAFLGEECGVDLLVIGTELNALFDNYTSYWTEAGGIIASVRANFTGKITYAGYIKDQGWATVAPLVDYLGIDYYPNMIQSNAVTGSTNVAELQSALVNGTYGCTTPADIGAFSASNGNMPIIFTETGYENRPASASANSGQSGTAPLEQGAAMQALIQTFEGGDHPWYAGMLIWGWWINSFGPNDNTFTQYETHADVVVEAELWQSSVAADAFNASVTLPSDIPEVATPLLLPLSALGLGAIGYVAKRHQERRHHPVVDSVVELPPVSYSEIPDTAPTGAMPFGSPSRHGDRDAGASSDDAGRPLKGE